MNLRIHSQMTTLYLQILDLHLTKTNCRVVSTGSAWSRWKTSHCCCRKSSFLGWVLRVVDAGNSEASILILILIQILGILVQALRARYFDGGLARQRVSNVHFAVFLSLMMGLAWPDSSSDLVGLVAGYCSVLHLQRLLLLHQTVRMLGHILVPGPFHRHQQ